jgi:NAD(P)-dependent dehydrogenase (short-subunit alcohol dehydrogenase family)
MRLEGKVAIVTGASSGMGRGIALRFGREGARVAAASRSNTESGQAVVRQIQEQGGQALYLQTDVRRPEDVERLVRITVETYGKLDILVNAAGIWQAEADPLELEEDLFDRMMSVNFRGQYLGCKYAIPEMVKSGGGSIVNITSTAGLVGEKGVGVAYSASKGGAVALTRSLSPTLGQYKIRINAICPELVDTPLVADLLQDPHNLEHFLEVMPVGRIGTPEDIASAAVFLASDEASLITGVALPVDGGCLAM